jgi:co-chaperonin GroES (HSP10)
MADVNVLETKRALKAAEEEAADAKQIPDPSGYRILCMVPKIDKEFAGGIVKAEETVRVEEHTSQVLFVVKLGPEAYKDPDKFPNGPWCKVGDFIVQRAYTGTRIKIHGTEFRIINDDTVEAVVQDPRGITRA